MVTMTNIERYNIGQVSSLGELFRKVMRRPSEDVTVVVPKSIKLTEEQLSALNTLPKVYGSNLPVERRSLQPAEVEGLYDQRKLLDSLDTAVKNAKEQIRTAVLNAMDVDFEEEIRAEAEAEAEMSNEDYDALDIEADVYHRLSLETRDKDGHYVRAVRMDVPGSEQCFSWEVVEGAPSVDVENLKAIADGGEEPLLSHEDYLAMTRQERVFDEAKFLEHLKTRPELLMVLPKITKAGTIRGSLFLRKKK